ncbi:UNVERIFIED_CONTAM: aminoacyltransferase [Streptococcus canis]|uniref:Aminoacyltransferase FemA n=1 Tax=Streptococcus canis FSL Z3-227 TaxID=482234 RepID=A0AAV3FR91_STRCB|nr:aminoacyltransferase [Streptococcus canis]EIQ81536.1 factor essential for expression of methicillin resistance [Streptococcus canis FSL Z3-227]MDV5988263.1 aminoacyltransferase [Streptococcus canis]MDV5994153.1 aminoacyltransferase [Streptococcus canis]MDV6022998.1 aminoacyltransferase [Streptococcus canis]VEE25761.1 femAB family protein [Streptococcus canis]
MALIDISQEQFDHYCHSLPHHSFIQTPEMAKLLSKRGAKTRFIGLEKEGDLKVAAMIFSQKVAGGWRMELNAGPNTNFPEYLEDFYSQLKNYAKEHQVIECIVKPYDIYQSFDATGKPTNQANSKLIDLLTKLGYQHDGLKTGYPYGEPVWHYLKSLEGMNSQDVIKTFSKTGKLHTKRAEKFGIQISQLSRDELKVFKHLTASTSDRQAFDDKSLDYYQDFYDAFGETAAFMVARLNFKSYLESLQPEKDKLDAQITRLQETIQTNPDNLKKQKELDAKQVQYQSLVQKLAKAETLYQEYGDQAVPLACALFIYTPQETVYLFGGSDAKFNDFYGPMLLQKHAMTHSIALGIPLYNFLGITGHFDGSDGVLRFKQKFTGYINQLYGTFRYYPNPLKYRLIRLTKKLLKRY